MLYAMGKSPLTVQFFQCQLFSFSNEAEDHKPGYEIESSVETEGSCWRHDGLHSRERQTEDTSYKEYVSEILVILGSERLTKGVVNAHGPSHSLLTLNGREHLSGVLERNWPFA